MLWTERSGDQILIEGDFPHLSTPALCPTQPPVQQHRVPFQGVNAAELLRLTPFPI
jgi:hypothetical protein